MYIYDVVYLLDKTYEMLLIEQYKNESRLNFINNLLSATYFDFVSHFFIYTGPCVVNRI